MPKSKITTIKARQTASRQFTDREEFITSFEERLTNYAYDDYNIIAFYGIGGIGKSALQKELIKRLQNKEDSNLIWCRLDFEEPNFRTAARALRFLRDKLTAPPFKIPFYSFDAAYIIYWRESNPGIALTQKNLPFLEQSSILADIVDSIGNIPVIGAIPKIGVIAMKGSNAVQSWWKNRGKKELFNLSNLQPFEIEDWLPLFFASDIRDYIINKKKKLVIFLDTFEALWQSSEERTEARYFKVDEWVRDLVNESKGVLFCISGREKLRWEEEDTDWEKVLEQHLVGDLSDEDAERFLISSGIKNKKLRSNIVQSAKGVPFYLDLAMDIWDEIKSEGEKPLPEDFKVNQKELVARFLKYLDAKEQETLKILSVCRSFDRELFEKLIDEFKTGYQPTRFEELVQFSFMNNLDSQGKLAIHDLMKSALIELIDKNIKDKVNEYLFRFYDTGLRIDDVKSITEEHTNKLEEAFYYAKNSKKAESFARWFFDTAEIFATGAKWKLLLRLYKGLTEYLRIILGEDCPETLMSMNNLAALLNSTWHYEEAELLFSEVLERRVKVLGEEHLDTLKSKNHLACLLISTNRNEEAELLLRQVLAIRKRVLGDEHEDTTSSMNNLAYLLSSTDRNEEAEPLYRRALELSKKVLEEEHIETAFYMNNLANLLVLTGQNEEAESLYKQALGIKKKVLGEDHPSTAISMRFLAELFDSTKRDKEAEPLYRKSLDIYKKVLGEEHPYTANIMNNLANLLVSTDRDEEAEPLYRRALEIRKKVLGEEHSVTATSMNNLAFLLDSTGRYEEAEPLFRQVLEIRKKVLGETDSVTVKSMRNLAELLNTIENIEEAEKLYKEASELEEKS